MIRYLTILIASAMLMACGPQQPQQPKEVTYIMPPELSDCKVHAIDSASAPKLYVVRCGSKGDKLPTETSVEWSQQVGKTTTYYRTVLIDGVEYTQKVDKQPKSDKVTIDGVDYIKAPK